MHYFIIKIPEKREIQQITLIIHQVLNLKTLRIFIKKAQQNLLRRIILYVLETIF